MKFTYHLTSAAANPLVFLSGVVFFIEFILLLMILAYIGPTNRPLVFWLFFIQAAGSIALWLVYVIAAAHDRYNMMRIAAGSNEKTQLLN